MGILVRCPCLNVTIHLQSLSQSTDFKWVEELSDIRTPSVGTVAPLAGVRVQIHALLTTRKLTHAWKTYKCWRCVGCDTDVYLSQNGLGEGKTVIVNGDLSAQVN